MWTRILPLLLLGAGAVVLAGCSSYNREWRAALKQPLPKDDISGPWEGHWISDSNGHNGRLRCIMTKTADGEYNANFHAKYKKILGFGYAVPLQARKSGKVWEFEGEADLGKLAGGRYSYLGAATPQKFLSNYDSKYDYGTFNMSRPISQQPAKTSPSARPGGRAGKSK